ncbi:MAG: hypothetical protein A3H98_10675 [Bacteroidetes bacterium RIFCSPLOWO2_02_FULL_36_8]|nr:MAG: hypothetical protein A3H98_10675 [Bacteroidetes bacterium RIFCSPLOWO2_02_FULL_36_8]OFY69763.1 MAG: hypothetical protein A3G23_11460 [Bacteroidetes bacterium RIFCSPLOWO2_12_FULL_37_12]
MFRKYYFAIVVNAEGDKAVDACIAEMGAGFRVDVEGECSAFHGAGIEAVAKRLRGGKGRVQEE